MRNENVEIAFNLPVKVREKRVEIQVVALKCDGILVDGQLIFRHVDNAGTEGLWLQVGRGRGITTRRRLTIFIFSNASLQSSNRYFAFRL